MPSAKEAAIRACREAADLAKAYALRNRDSTHQHEAVDIFVQRQNVLQAYGRADRAGAQELLKLTDLSEWARENLSSTEALARQEELAVLRKQDRAQADNALREQISSAAETYPNGGLAIVLADKMAALLSGDAPEAPSAFWTELSGSGSERLRTHAAARLTMEVAKRVPMEIAFTAIDGRAVDLHKLRGRVVLVVFAGVTWCAPCREEEKRLKQLYNHYGRDELEIFAISWEYTPESRDKVASLLRDRQIPWPYFFDGRSQENPFLVRFGIRAVPHTFLLDRRGLLVASGLEGERLTTAVNDLIETKPQARAKTLPDRG